VESPPRGEHRSFLSKPTLSTGIVVSAVTVGVFLVFSAVALVESSPLCQAAPGSRELIGGRTYCAATVSVPTQTGNTSANHTEWGFFFQLIQPVTFGFNSFFVMGVTEPGPLGGVMWGYLMTGPGGVQACYGTWGTGGPRVCNPAQNTSTPVWLTPDSSAGVMFFPSSLQLLVES